MIARKGLTYNDIFLSPTPMRRPFGQWHDRKLSERSRLVSPRWLAHRPGLTVTAVTRKGICGCYAWTLRASFRLPSSKRAAGMPLTTSQVQSASRKRALEQSLHACPLVTSLVRLPFPPFHFSTSVNSLRLRCSTRWKLTRSYNFLQLWLCTFSNSPPHYRGIMVTVVKVVSPFLVPSCVPGA